MGVLKWELLEPKIAPPIYYVAQTGLISLENTHNMAGGTVTPQAVMDEVCDRAHERNIPVHLDGARVFNAAAALDTMVAKLTAKVDSVMFCLSKGLGAPVGSLLVGNKEFIKEARSVRKALGGGMRQAGVLAAAGLIALEEGPGRLHEDHANARLLANGLAQIAGVKIDLATVQTNIVIFDISGTGMQAGDIVTRLKERGVVCGSINPQTIRFVTHCNVSRSDCEQALRAMEAVCSAKVSA